MDKKNTKFRWFRSRNEQKTTESDEIQNKTPNAGAEPTDYESYLAGCAASTYSGFILETRYTRDKFPENYAEQFQTIIDTCRQVFMVSNIHYFITRANQAGGKFVCYLNFDNNNIRVITEFVKQLLYNNTNYIDFNIFYASGTDSPEEVKAELDFLLNMPPYSLIFGYNKKIRGFYFKDCELSDAVINPAPLAISLKENRIEDAINFLIEEKEIFDKIIHTDLRYSYRRIYDFLIDAYLTLMDFYRNPEMPGPEYSENFEGYLSEFEDAAHFIDKLCKDLQDYADKYPAFRMQSLESDLIRNAMDYIKEHIASVTLQDVATHFNVSYAHLSRLFRKNTRMNFTDYVADIKLDLATELLKETNLNIADISCRLGYNSPSYFLNKFKDRYKVTPSVYRKKYFIENGKG